VNARERIFLPIPSCCVRACLLPLRAPILRRMTGVPNIFLSRARRQSWYHAGTQMTSILLSRLMAFCPLEWFPSRSTWLLRRNACTVWPTLKFFEAFCFGRQSPVSHMSTSGACFVAGCVVPHPLGCAAAPASFSHLRIETLRGALDATAICSFTDIQPALRTTDKPALARIGQTRWMVRHRP
jgi:hypothetical protein